MNAEEEKRHAVEEYEGVKKDQDDLLLLLSDQENKIKEYKTRLKALGETVSFLVLNNVVIETPKSA